MKSGNVVVPTFDSDASANVMSVGANVTPGPMFVVPPVIDHVGTDKWSLRVKLTDDKLMGMSVFSVQAPFTRGFLWDQRNSWVIENKDERSEAIRFRRAERRRFPERINKQQEAELERRIDDHMNTWLDRYPEFLEEYRKQLEGWRRFRGVGLVLGAKGDNLDARFAAVFRASDGAP